MRFYLGVHNPAFLERTAVPLFISFHRLRRRQTFPRARGPWALDSGAFSEIKTYGSWTVSAGEYAIRVQEIAGAVGRMEWAATQDWMCESIMVARTGLSIRRHQELTTANYLVLDRLAPSVSWVPVIQGWDLEDYQRHVRMYRSEGIDLRSFDRVGIGSVCRRQATAEAEEIIHRLASDGLRLHAFGFKAEGLRRCGAVLESADSMAWSFGARAAQYRMPGCRHSNCANCLRYALAWRDRILGV